MFPYTLHASPSVPKRQKERAKQPRASSGRALFAHTQKAYLGRETEGNYAVTFFTYSYSCEGAVHFCAILTGILWEM